MRTTKDPEHMKRALSAKFENHDDLQEFLVDTGTKKLAEASRDTFWGCRKTLRDDDVLKPKTWKGKNNMGKLLEELRTELQSDYIYIYRTYLIIWSN